MKISVGIDVAKEVHWATAIDEAATVLLDLRVENTPQAVDQLIGRLRALDDDIVVGLDVVGSFAAFLEASLLAAGFRLVHVPGLAVNRARQGLVGGENKSDPRDARVIAEQVRVRHDLRPIEPDEETTAELRVLTSRRRDLVEEQTRRLSRLHASLATIHPGLERSLDLTTKGPLWLLTRYVTPAELRRAGRSRLLQHLRRGGGLRNLDRLADAALAAAQAQRIAVPGERTAAAVIRELATEALAARARIAQLDRELEALLERHPDAALIRTLPGMGVIHTAELIARAGNLDRFRSADALAAAAGLAPILRQSGKVRYQRRPIGGNKALKQVFYRAAFCSLGDPQSRAYYDRKRTEGKSHDQAVIALARRRINVLWAMLHNRQAFVPNHRKAA
ncbi:MAG: IS110 family transposase [Geminicoccales bacterium]